MKGFSKEFSAVAKVVLIGLFVTVFFHPMIHESGHIIASLLTGGRIISIVWLPVPNVLCEADSTNAAAIAITSLAGIVFPMLFVLPFYKSKGSLRFGLMVFSAVSVLSAAIGLFTAVLRLYGTAMPDDDVTVFIESTGMVFPTVLIMLSLMGIAFLQFLLLKPKQIFSKIMDTAKICTAESSMTI